ncbi:MAG: FHA domain-containing protein, partial [Planctomycetota bacterium]
MPKLRIRNGPQNGRERTLEGKAVNIGRDAEAGIQILDRSASRFHAEVFPVGGMYFARDLDSKNGTFVNDDPLTDEELLREGDVIKIGSTELIYEAGVAVSDSDSHDHIAYQDDAEMLSHTIEFRIDDLRDLEDEAESDAKQDEGARALQMLYQLGKLVAEGQRNEAANRVMDYLVLTMPADAALVFLRSNASGGKLVPYAVRTAEGVKNPIISRAIIRRTVGENRALFVADTTTDKRFAGKEQNHGLRSIICVPLQVAGRTRGVIYLSRGKHGKPFAKSDMELISACALQLGLSIEADERRQREQRNLWQTMTALTRALELQAKTSGVGTRCACAAAALATSFKLSPEAVWQCQAAALLEHLNQITDSDGESGAQFLGPSFKPISELIELSRERIDGSGPK